MICPFQPSAFGDVEEKATRLTCELDLSDDQCEQLAALDCWAQEEGRKLCKGEYKPVVHVDKHGNRRIRTKLSTTGIHACKFWDPMRSPLGICKEMKLQGATMTPVVAVKCLWTMAGQFGLTVELRHAIVNLDSQECPELA